MISAIERCKYLSLEFIVGSSFSTTGRKEGGGGRMWISLLISLLIGFPFPFPLVLKRSRYRQIPYYEGSEA